jgi:2-C-methyl-D-erythritol 4-phosphate cytidylyltransferase
MTLQRDLGLILAAAGQGARFGSNVPKQFWELNGKPLYLHALEPFLGLVADAVIVVPAEWEHRVEVQVASISTHTLIRIQPGGLTRQVSVLKGLNRFTSDPRYILVHDAARPFVSSTLVESVVEESRRRGACIPVVPVRDTVKRVRAGLVVQTIDRHELSLTQTPQGFSSTLLRRAFENAEKEGFQGTDESSLIERLGEPVGVVEGETGNLKLTWPEDLRLFGENASVRNSE